MARNKDRGDEVMMAGDAGVVAVQQGDVDTDGQDQLAAVRKDEKTTLTTLQEMRLQVNESDESPSGSLRLRDVLGGEFLWTLVRKQAWLIILVVFITTAYIGIRYQCQQDAIDISQLEKDLLNAKYESLASSSNLTRLCRQSNVLEMLNAADSTQLRPGTQPPYIIQVPQE